LEESDQFRRIVLPSGLTVIGEHVDSVRSVSIGVWVRVGARYEPPAEAGMSHFLEHMVFKGTETRDAYELALSLESVGGHLDAFTGARSPASTRGPWTSTWIWRSRSWRPRAEPAT